MENGIIAGRKVGRFGGHGDIKFKFTNNYKNNYSCAITFCLYSEWSIRPSLHV